MEFYLEFSKIGELGIPLDVLRLTLSTTETEAAAATAASKETSCQDATRPENTLEPFRRKHHHMVDYFIAKLLGNIQAKRPVLVVYAALLFVRQDTVSVIDFLELKAEFRNQIKSVT